MIQYIDKAAVVEEIKRNISLFQKEMKTEKWSTEASQMNVIILSAKVTALKEVLSFLNTLEVKEANLENSMVCKVNWYDGFLLDYTQEQQDELLEKMGAKVGDKIKLILIKE